MNYGFIDIKDKIITGIIIDNKIKSYKEYDPNELTIGSIIRGKIIKKLPWLDSYEIEISDEESAILPFKDKINDEKIQTLVMVAKQKENGKKIRVTEKLLIKGKYIIIDPFADGIYISKKINSAKTREELKNIGDRLGPKDGIIFRTAAVDAKESDIIQEYKSLSIRKDMILSEINFLPTPKLIYWQKPEIEKEFLGFIDKIDKIIINNQAVYNEIMKNKKLKDLIFLDLNYNSLEDRLIQFELGNRLSRKINIDGAEMVIDELEALTVIDINSSFMKKGISKEQNAKFVNFKLLDEIAKQLMIRKIRGIIYIDFIRMNKTDSKDLLEKLKKIFSEYGLDCGYIGFTMAGIMEIILKR